MLGTYRCPAESELYYLNSRYYDSKVGRFISEDEISYLGLDGTVGSYNLYAYCLNNPVNMIDSEGNFSILICVIVGVVSATYTAITDYKDDNEINGSIGWETYVGNALIGAVGGLVCGGCVLGVQKYAIPHLTKLINTTFTFSAGLTALASGAAALAPEVVITGKEIVAGAAI